MNIKEIKQKIATETNISVVDSFDIARQCSIFLNVETSADDGRKIIVHILNNWKKIPLETHEMWTDVIELAGFYPYLEKEKKNIKFKNLSGELRKELHFADDIINDKKIYFHEEQKILKNILENGKNLIVSAPTSFGKSLLIEDIVASKRYKNIIVIQPTLALLDETRKKLKKYNNDYKIIVRTSQLPDDGKGNLFLLTSERVLEYRKFPQINFLVIDEFYKLSTSRDDERAEHLNNAFYQILKQFNPQFYLLGPNIEGISTGFEEKYNAEFYKTNYSLIDNKIVDIYTQYKEEFDKTTHHKKKGYYEALELKEKVLFDLLYDLRKEQSIVYCKSPNSVTNLAIKFSNYLKEKDIEIENNLPLLEWIKLNVSPSWNLLNFLKYKIGINNGTIQKHINSSIVTYFNDEKLNYLFCTTTLIEGVNTSAKNIIIYDNVKGKDTKIDFFDHANIKGRSGRMMIHYIGKIYDFNSPPAKEAIIVDIPFYEQSKDVKKFPPEIEIVIDDSDIKNKDRDQYKELQNIPLDLKRIIKDNGLSVNGQLKIIEELSNLNKIITIKRSNYEKQYPLYDLLYWTTPNYDQLQFLFSLCWTYLKKPKESLSLYSYRQLTQRVASYSSSKDIPLLIEDTFKNYKNAREKQSASWHKQYKDKTDEVLLNEAINDTFQLLRHWFQYKVPKWLNVINELQKYVCEKNDVKHGDYSWYAGQIENDFIQDNLAIFLEYGIPKSAIEKMKNLMKPDLSEDRIIQIAKDYAKNVDNDLIIYEKEKINESL